MKKNLQKIGVVAVFLVLGVVLVITVLPAAEKAKIANFVPDLFLVKVVYATNNFSDGEDRFVPGNPLRTGDHVSYVLSDNMKVPGDLPPKYQPVKDAVDHLFPGNITVYHIYDDGGLRLVVKDKTEMNRDISLKTLDQFFADGSPDHVIGELVKLSV